jgi:acyl carrier protein
MTEKHIYEELTGIFQEIFDSEDLLINANSSVKDINAWDSIHHLNLILKVEQKWDIKFLSSEIVSLENVGMLADLILSKQNVAAA